MSAFRSRSVLLVTMAGCVAALLVALLVGNASEASAPTSVGKSPREGCALAQAVTRANELPGRHPGVRMFRHPCGGTVLQVSASQPRSAGGGDGTQPVSTVAPEHADGFVKVAHGDDQISFSPLAARSVSRKTRGGTTSYADPFPGATLNYTSTADGLKETIVLADASTTRFRFRLRLSEGLVAAQRGHGVVVERDGGSSRPSRRPS